MSESTPRARECPNCSAEHRGNRPFCQRCVDALAHMPMPLQEAMLEGESLTDEVVDDMERHLGTSEGQGRSEAPGR